MKARRVNCVICRAPIRRRGESDYYCCGECERTLHQITEAHTGPAPLTAEQEWEESERRMTHRVAAH